MINQLASCLRTYRRALTDGLLTVVDPRAHYLSKATDAADLERRLRAWPAQEYRAALVSVAR